MSDHTPDLNNLPTSPTLDVDAGIVHTPKEFSDVLTLDLTDDEIQQAYVIISRIKTRYQARFAARFGPHIVSGSNISQVAEEAAKMVDEMEDELVTTLAERLDLIATVDMAPVFAGDPPTIELVGALGSHSSAKYGMDHEKKTWEVQKAKERGEDFLGSNDLE